MYGIQNIVSNISEISVSFNVVYVMLVLAGVDYVRELENCLYKYIRKYP